MLVKYNYFVPSDEVENKNIRLYTKEYRDDWDKSNVNLHAITSRRKRKQIECDISSKSDTETVNKNEEEASKSNVNWKECSKEDAPSNKTPDPKVPYGGLREFQCVY